MRILTRGLIFSAAIVLASCQPSDDGGGEQAPAATPTTYMGSWNCGSQNQCAIVMGAASGCRQFTSLSACQSFFGNTTFGNSCRLGACSTTPGSGPLSSISEILNGPNAAGQTSYWRIGGLYGIRIGALTDIAFFADGTGKLIARQNSCLIPLDPAWPVVDQVPVVSAFTWTATGPSSMAFTDATYHCTNDRWNNLNLTALYDPLLSMSNISGGISMATFDATFSPQFNFRGFSTGTLLSGTF